MQQNPQILQQYSSVSNYKFGNSAEVLELDASIILADAEELMLLAKRFSPILNLHPHEEHHIVNVDWYLQKMHLVNEQDQSTHNFNPTNFPPKLLSHQHYFLESKNNIKKIIDSNTSLAKTYVQARNFENKFIDLQYWYLFSGKGCSTANIKWSVEGIVGHNKKVNLDSIVCKDGHWDRITVRVDCETLSLKKVFLPNAFGGEWIAIDKIEMNGDHPSIYVSKNNHKFYTNKGVKMIEFLKFKVLSSTIEFSFYDECCKGDEVDFSQCCELISSDAIEIQPKWLNYQGKWANQGLQNLNSKKINLDLKAAFGKDLAFLLGNHISDDLTAFLISHYSKECKFKTLGPKKY